MGYFKLNGFAQQRKQWREVKAICKMEENICKLNPEKMGIIKNAQHTHTIQEKESKQNQIINGMQRFRVDYWRKAT